MLCFAGLLPAAAQVGAQDVAQGFFDTVDVEIVNVEVYVTDRQGQPVTGLEAADFEVTHDGEPVAISNFFAASDTASAPASLAQPLAERAAGHQPIELAPIHQQLNLLLFVDNRNIAPKNRNRAIAAIRQSVLTDLRPQDRVTVISFDGSLQIRQKVTSDAAELEKALEEISLSGASGVHAGLDRLSILRELQQTDLQNETLQIADSLPGAGLQEDTTDWGGILQSIRGYARQEYDRTRATVDMLGQFVDTLAGMKGRKALIYVSDGISLRPGEALFNAFGLKVPPDALGIGVGATELEAREYDATGLFEALGKRANASRVTFYTILAAGGSPQTMTPAEQSAFFNTTGTASNQQVWNSSLEAIENANFKGSMQILAEATGGLATLNTKNFDQALKRIQKDFGTYYSLGYEAPDSGDFDDHRIRVKVRRDGLEVRHRESYRLRSAEEQMKVRTQSALLFEETDNPLGVRIDFGVPREDEKGLYLLPVIVKFPLAKIVLAPGEHSHQGQVSIFVGARATEDGGLSPVQKLPAPVTIPNDKMMTALGQVAGYRMMLHLRPGEHSVAVSVRDEVAQVESTTTTTVDAADLAADLPGAEAPAAAAGAATPASRGD